MVKVTFVQANGERKIVDAEIGKSLMEAAVKNGIAGVPADCGGACSCATCHCYIDLNFLDDLPPASADVRICRRSERKLSINMPS